MRNACSFTNAAVLNSSTPYWLPLLLLLLLLLLSI